MIQQLLFGLNNTKAEYVLLDISQVIEAIGVEKTTKLCLVTTTMSSTTSKKKRTKVSRKTGLGKFVRQDVIRALYAAKEHRNSRGTRESDTRQL